MLMALLNPKWLELGLFFACIFVVYLAHGIFHAVAVLIFLQIIFGGRS